MLAHTGPESDPKDVDSLSTNRPIMPFKPVKSTGNLLIVNRTGELSYTCWLANPGGIVYQKVRVDGCAVSANTEARHQKSCLTIGVSSLANAGKIDANGFGVCGQFICNRNVNVAIYHAGQLRKLCRLECGEIRDWTT